jgi:predicted transcriptional regulator
MTIKEIAELCGVDEKEVRRWIGSLKNVKNGQNVHSLQNLDKTGRGKTLNFPVETAAAIIRARDREALAALLAENAATKDQLAVYNNRHTGLRDEIEAIIDKKI